MSTLAICLRARGLGTASHCHPHKDGSAAGNECLQDFTVFIVFPVLIFYYFILLPFKRICPCGWFYVVVTELVTSMKLSYIKPG